MNVIERVGDWTTGISFIVNKNSGRIPDMKCQRRCQNNLAVGMAALTLCFFMGFISADGAEKGRSGGKPNILLIVPDALRAKQLPCYGYQRIRTSALDSLVGNSALFKYCFVKTPNTNDSFSYLFSGQWFGSEGLKKGKKTLAQYLKEDGYHTVGFISSDNLMSVKTPPENGYGRGFDEYFQDEALARPPHQRKNEKTTADILDWLGRSENLSKPFFLFAHYMDPHSPYEPSYDVEVEKIDHELGRIVEKLKELALYENSLLIFTSDHGESLGDHGSPDGHGWFLYAEQIQVPLIMKFPGNRYARIVDQVVRHIDIMPTILDFTGVKFEKKSMTGKSLLPAIKGNHKLGLVSYHSTGPSRVCPEGLNGVIFEDQNRIYHYTQGRFSSRYRELFELREDPDEIRNLVENPRLAAVVQQAQQHLARFRSQSGSSRRKASSEPPQRIPREKLEALKALGYVAGGAPAPSEMSHNFLMQVRLDSIGTVVYSDFIRYPEWGKSLKDDRFPRKLVTAENDRIYIISEPGQKIFLYRKNEGFRDLAMEGVTDLVPRSDGKSLIIVRQNKISLLNLERGGADRKDAGLEKLFPCLGLCSDPKNNLYVLMEKRLLKMNKEGKIIRTYEVSVPDSRLLAIDGEENLYLGVLGEIQKWSPEGIRLQSFGRSELPGGICSLAVDSKGNLWVLEKDAPAVMVFDRNGVKKGSFIYNSYNEKWERPVPCLQLFICLDRIYIMDSWEGIFVYRLE
jgi:arylsulfatase A-like enzyme